MFAAYGQNPMHNLHQDTWVATDALGRTLPSYQECGPVKKDRYVGMFYFITHNDPKAKGPFDVTKIMQQNPISPKWGEGSHFWGQPEDGYYLSYDKWVIKKHANLLADAGVDVIIFDVTNDKTYPDVYLKVCEVFADMRSKGEKTPSISFLGSEISVNELWKDFYQKGIYKDLWFIWKGKPLLLFGQHEVPSRKKNNDVVFSEDIQNFFNIRQSWAWTTLPWYQSAEFGKDKWPWIDHFPQAISWHESRDKAEMIPVSVAQHPLSNIGRSFHNFSQPQTDKYDLTPYTNQGLYFEEQWSRALEVEPEFVFVTGWNEWSAGAQIMGKDINKSLQKWAFYPGAHLGNAGKPLKVGDHYFIDQYNQEFSRDIEPMVGGHTDNYYYQLMANIRKYKGMEMPESIEALKTININGDFEQWSSISSTYQDHIFDTDQRYSAGQGIASGIYQNNTGRNDFKNFKIAYDAEYVYFYAQTRETITSEKGKNWMLLYIDTDQNKKTGWEGYDFVINTKVIDKRTTTLSSIHLDGTLSNPVKVNYKTIGNQLMIAVKRSNLKQKNDLAFDFHWADHIQKLGDINEFFIYGDNAPERRANYHFQTAKQ